MKINLLPLYVCCFITFSSAIQIIKADSLYDKLYTTSVEILLDRHMDGSGTIVSKDGYILTAAHIFQKKFTLLQIDSPIHNKHAAELVAIDRGNDIALLKISEPPSELNHLDIALKSPKPGDVVYLFGSPLFRRTIMSPGVVAAKSTGFEFYGKLYCEVLYLANVTTKGSSGGPWVNNNAKLIGTQSGIMAINGNSHGLAFCSKLSAIRRILETKENAKTVSLGLGVEEIGEQNPEFIKKLPQEIDGVITRAVLKDGPASKAGIKNGLVVLSINGKQVTKRNNFFKILRRSNIDKEVTLEIYNPEDQNTFQIKIMPMILERDLSF